MDFRKTITEEEILAWIKKGEFEVPPLTVEDVQVVSQSRDTAIDAVLTMSWLDKPFRFGAEVRRLWTPKAISAAADEILRTADIQKLSPMVVVPYLSGERLRELEARGVSGLDLCGNAVLVVPGQLLVFRSGSPNQFRWEGKIKNVYRGTSAIVARVFLLKREFRSVGDALDEIRTRGGKVTLPTVSKVCKSLEQDLVIERTQGETPASRRLHLLQPEKLLELLRDNYAAPEVSRTLSGKYSGPIAALVDRLRDWSGEGKERKIMLTGASSAEAYTVMAREPIQSFYCSDVAALKKSLGGDFTETERFSSVRFIETNDDFVYFDRRQGLVASPVQSYLELATGEKREKETSEQVRRFILNRPPETKGQR